MCIAKGWDISRTATWGLAIKNKVEEVARTDEVSACLLIMGLEVVRSSIEST